MQIFANLPKSRQNEFEFIVILNPGSAYHAPLNFTRVLKLGIDLRFSVEAMVRGYHTIDNIASL